MSHACKRLLTRANCIRVACNIDLQWSVAAPRADQRMLVWTKHASFLLLLHSTEQHVSNSLSSLHRSFICAHKLWKTRPHLLWHLWSACMGEPPKMHPWMAQVVVCGRFFAMIAGGGFFRAGIFRSESKTAARRSLPAALELSPWLRRKPVGRRTNNRLPFVAIPSPAA